MPRPRPDAPIPDQLQLRLGQLYDQLAQRLRVQPQPHYLHRVVVPFGDGKEDGFIIRSGFRVTKHEDGSFTLSLERRNPRTSNTRIVRIDHLPGPWWDHLTPGRIQKLLAHLDRLTREYTEQEADRMTAEAVADEDHLSTVRELMLHEELEDDE